MTTIRSRIKRHWKKIAIAGGVLAGTAISLYLAKKYKINTRLPKIKIPSLWKAKNKEDITDEASYEYHSNMNELRRSLNETTDPLDRKYFEIQIKKLEKNYNEQNSLVNRVWNLKNKFDENGDKLNRLYYDYPWFQKFYDDSKRQLVDQATDIMGKLNQTNQDIIEYESYLETPEYNNLDNDQKQQKGIELEQLKGKRKKQEVLSKKIDDLIDQLNNENTTEEEAQYLIEKINRLEEESNKSTSFGKTIKKPKKLTTLKNDLKRLKNV